MKKKLIVALATTLILANGATAAFADSESDSGKSENSSSDECRGEHFGWTDAQKVAHKAALEANQVARKVIMATFHTAMENARNAYKTAKEAATTDEAREAAKVAYKTAKTAAIEIKTAALKALTPVAKPTLTAEQLAAIAKYRQDMIAFHAAMTVYRGQREANREAIREAFKSAREAAKDAFKAARDLATTDVAREAARDAFRTAIEAARTAFETARTALGDAPVKPEEPNCNS